MPDARRLLQDGYRYALALTHHHRDAEDLVHDAWLSAQGRWRQPTRRYLYAAIRHRWVDRMRRRAREVLLDSVEPTSDPIPDVETPIDRLDLEAALSALRPREREALYLMTVEGWTARDVARLWETPRGTVLSLVHRAKTKLAKALTRGETYVDQEAR